MLDYLKVNREGWDRRTRVHVASKFYDVEGFLEGDCPLREIELAEMPDVAGKSLLHLQCHFGLDTLSWARKGAGVTGVDLSPEAIRQANEIKAKAKLDGRFICSDVYTFGENNTEQYDIVFTSYGALCWLPCVKRWAETIAGSLKDGGTFYMVEFHPAFDLAEGYTYFHLAQPDAEEEGTYTENCKGEKSLLMTWGHSLGDVINALIHVGIQINHVNEFAFSPYDCFEGLEEKEPGRFYTKGKYPVPMVYSILGTKRG